jgi:hypothetical protein
MKITYPQLFSFTRKPKCSIRFFIDQEVKRLFSLPLSTQAARQVEEIKQILEGREWDENTHDSWSYTWGNHTYSSKKAYKLLIGDSEASPLFSWLWASSNLGKHKFFFWLLIRDRLNTRNMLRRKICIWMITTVSCAMLVLRKQASTYFLNAHLARPAGTPYLYNAI